MSSKSAKTMSSKSSKSFIENSSYNPSTPLFDTCSSENSEDSDYDESLQSPKHRRGRYGKHPRTEAKAKGSDARKRYDDFAESSDVEEYPPPSKRGRRGRRNLYAEPSPEKDLASDKAPSPTKKDDPNSVEERNNAERSKYEEYLNAPCRIVSGRYAGLTGRIERVVSSGWVYIAENESIDRPLRWKDVVILNEEGESDEPVEEDSTNASIYGHQTPGTRAEKLSEEKEESGYHVKEEQSPSHASQCKVEGCVKWRQSQCGKYCKAHHKKLMLEGVVEPDLVGAKIRLTHPSHAGVKGTIIEHKCSVYLKVKWNYAEGKSLPKIVPLEDVSGISSISGNNSSSIDVNKEYSGAIVKKDGVTGKVKKAILSEWYITDIANREKGFKRSDFVVLKYASGIAPEGNLKDDGANEIAGSHDRADEYSVESECNEESSNPLIGVKVLIVEGSYKGQIGKVVSIRSRGWLEVEGMDKKVKYSCINLVDDGTLDLGAIEGYLRDTGVLKKMPHVVDSNNVLSAENDVRSADVESRRSSTRSDSDKAELDKGEQSSPALISNMYGNNTFKHKIYSTDFCGPGTKSEDEPNVKWGRKSNASLTMPNIPLLNANSARHQLRIRGRHVPVLDPILVQPVGDYCEGNSSAKTQYALKIIPEGLRHLPPDTPIEIFNRRTGRIMRGDETIALSDLPAALINHSEYEPIVPPPSNVKMCSRAGRSSKSIRVSKDVIPQSRVRTSAVEGSKVVVTGGEYRGRVGTIDSAIPGGWYLVSNLFDNNSDLDAVVNSEHLELVPLPPQGPQG